MPLDRHAAHWLEDPVAEQEAFSSLEMSRNTARRLLGMSTPEAAAEIATISTFYPTISPELATSAFVSGIPAEDDYLAQATAYEQAQTGEVGGGLFGAIRTGLGWVGDRIREGTRWTALAFTGLYDELINRPLRTMTNITQGQSLGEAYANSGNAPFGAFGEAIVAVADPYQSPNLGTGWLPQSQLASEVEDQLAELTEDMYTILGRKPEEGFLSEMFGLTTESKAVSPAEQQAIYEKYRQRWGYVAPTFLSAQQQAMMLQSQITEKIMDAASNPNTSLGQAQSRFGTPVTQRAMAEANSVIMNLKGIHGADHNYSQVSMGRVFGGLVTESGTDAHHWLTGSLDFLANIFMDPANALGAGAARGLTRIKKLAPGKLGNQIIKETAEALAEGGAKSIDDVGRRVEELQGFIDDAQFNPHYQRYQGYSPQGRANAEKYARMGERTAPRAEKTRQAGLVARQVREAEEELGRLAGDPDLIKYQNYSDAYRARMLELEKHVDADTGEITFKPLNERAINALARKNSKLASSYRTYRRAVDVEDGINTLQHKVAELTQRDEWKSFNKWKPSTQERALRYAAESTFDPATTSAQKVKMQQTAREALRIKDEIAEFNSQIDVLNNTANYEYQIRKLAGVVDDSNRKGVDKVRVNDFIRGKNAEPLVDTLVAADLAGVDDILDKFKGIIPRQSRLKLADATTREEVISVLLQHMAGGGFTEVPTMGLGTFLKLRNPTTKMHNMVKYRVARNMAEKGWDSVQSKPHQINLRLKRAFSQMSPGHLDLNDMDTAYSLLTRHAKNIGWERGDETLERVLRQFAEIADGDYDAAFDILAEYRKVSIERLTENGLHKDVARAVTDFIGNEKAAARYWQDEAGNVLFDDKIMVAATDMRTRVKPHLYSEMFKGVVHMPNPRLVRHAAAELDGLGRFINRLATVGGWKPSAIRQSFDQRWAIRATNQIMTKYWKPAVLLRLAWPIRVIGEEQARMAAAGISKPMAHPFQMMARIIADKDNLDVLGDAFTHADEFARASARRVQFQGDYQSWGLQHWESLERAQVGITGGIRKVDWANGYLAELNDLWSDPIVRMLFEPTSEATGLNRIEAVTDYLYDGPGRKLIDNLSRNADNATKEAMKTREGVKFYVESVYARSHQKAGGKWRIYKPQLDMNGKRIGTEWRDQDGITGVFGLDDPMVGQPVNHVDRASYVVTENGIDELVESYGTGKWREINVAERMAEDAGVLKANPGMTDIRSVRAEIMKMMDDEVLSKRLPQRVKGTLDALSPEANKFDEFVTTMFDLLMSKPTNRLSRHPAFKEYYWRHLGEQAVWMDEATLAAARAGARDAGKLEALTSVTKKAIESEKEILGIGVKGSALREFDDALKQAKIAAKGVPSNEFGWITNLEQADQVAKAKALTSVQDLLFDVSKRANISDAFSILMPFADAWGEVVGTWIRIMRQENIKPFRRFQQLIESGRESNPFDPASGYSNQGFFYRSGDREVFTVPAINSLYRTLHELLPFGSAEGIDAEWEYGLQGLSIATDVLPAVGPVVQMATQPIIPNDPQWNWLRDYVSPFGRQSIQRGLTPTSWQRFLAAFDFTRNVFSDQSLQYLYDGAVQDALGWMERNDPEFAEKYRTDPEAVLAEAKGRATDLFIVQGIARFAGPAAPSTRPVEEDKHGVVWQLTALSDEYYNILQKHEGDDLAAREEFMYTFGIDPVSITTAKSTGIVPRSSTSVGYNFKLQNPDLFNKYPTIAYYLGPAHLETYLEFDYNAYYDSLVEGSRERLTPDQWVRMLNDTKGRLAYDAAIRNIEEFAGLNWNDPGWDTATKRQIANDLRTLDQELMHRFEGYAGQQFGSEVEGIPAKVSVERQVTELQAAVAENPQLLALDEDGVPNNPALYATQIYLKLRDRLSAASRTVEGQWKTGGQDDPESPHFRARQTLRQIAAQLIVKYPEFGPVWEGVFSREIYDDFEQELTIQDAYEIIFGEEEPINE